MDNLGGSYRFWGFGRRIQGKVSPLGVSAKTQSWLRLRLMGIAFGGVLSLLGLFVRALHLTAFLLFVLNTRVLTIAHITPFGEFTLQYPCVVGLKTCTGHQHCCPAAKGLCNASMFMGSSSTPPYYSPPYTTPLCSPLIKLN